MGNSLCGSGTKVKSIERDKSVGIENNKSKTELCTCGELNVDNSSKNEEKPVILKKTDQNGKVNVLLTTHGKMKTEEVLNESSDNLPGMPTPQS